MYKQTIVKSTTIFFLLFSNLVFVSTSWSIDDMFIGQLLGDSLSTSVALGDLDGDGDLDAFVANSNYGPNEVWLNDGTGIFTDSGQLLGESSSNDVALGDVDGDGDLDAFVANFVTYNRVFLNDGTGIFTDSGNSAVQSWSSNVVALGDVDADGDIDAFLKYWNPPRWSLPCSVSWNDGTGTFNSKGKYLGTIGSSEIALGDVDGDGDLDAFVVNSSVPYYQDNSNQVWLNDGMGNYTDSGQSLGNSNSADVKLGDLDADGDLDALIAEGNSMEVWLNDGKGIFADSGQLIGNSNSNGAALGDMDGDGDLDAFVASANSDPNEVWLNDGTGIFTDSGQHLGESSSNDVALGDVDGDGDLDVFVANAGPNEVWLNKTADPLRAFVTRFYQLFLDRDPDKAGLNGWVETLLKGTQTGGSVANGFVFSQEFTNKNTTAEEYITILYEAFFNRTPDPAGLQGWLASIANGASRTDVLNGFIYATEFAELCEEYGIKAFKGHISKDQREKVEAFLTRFYQLCLGRNPDAAGLKVWTDNLLNQIQTGADVANGFIYSQEFLNKNTTNEEYLTILYKAFFNRGPDQAGWDVWIAELNSGRDRGYILNGFLGSQEFINLCEGYGINPF